jgi:hypothetical protein
MSLQDSAGVAILKTVSGVRFTIDMAIAFASRIKFHFSKPQPNVIEDFWEGVDTVRQRVAVFCHFDAQGQVSQNVLHYIRELHGAGLSVIFVTAAPTLNAEAIAALAPFTARILRRRNQGYDFGCYRDGLWSIDGWQDLDLLLLVNDSVIGPFGSLRAVLARCDESADVWGLTESLERGRHLQSYFLAFGKKALQSQAFDQFWRGYRLANAKAWAVLAGELGLSRALSDAGLTLKALASFSDLRSAFLRKAEARNIAPRLARFGGARDDAHVLALCRQRLNFNPTHFFWREIIEDFALPFVKRELILRNPGRIQGVSDWRSVVEAAFGQSDPFGALHVR